LEFRLFLDPKNDGSGSTFLYAEWSSDGTFGENIGDPMPMPAAVPTLSEWGLVVLSAFVLLMSVYYLRR